MAQTIDIHPVRFGHELNCGIRNGGYTQIVQCGDVTQFQIQMEECSSELNLVSNPDFTDGTPSPWVQNGAASWVYSSGSGTYQKNGDGAGYIEQSFNVADGVLVKLTFEIEVISDDVTVICGSTPATAYIETFDSSGTYTRYIVADDWQSIIFYGFAASSSFVLSYVNVTAINTNYSVRIVNSLTGSEVRELNPIDDSDYFNFNGNNLTFTYDWLDDDLECLPDGCYYFEVSEPCDCGSGGFVAEDFITVQNQWQGVGVAWSFNGTGTAIYDGTTSPDDIYVDNVVCAGEQYEVSYTLAAMNAGNEFQVRLGAQLGLNRTTNGSFTETITASGSLLTEVMLIGRDTGGGGAFQVTNFSIRKLVRNYSLKSNLFRLWQEAPCSILLRVCNDEDSMQADFVETGFSPRIRLEAKFGQAQYRSTFKDYENSIGRMSNYYYRGRKKFTLTFAAAEYVHDFIAHLKGYDHVFIDEVEYAVESEDYNPQYVENYDYASVSVELSLKESLIEKRKCTSTESVCSSDGQEVELLAETGVPIESEDGTKLLTG